MKSVGENIKDLRIARKITQTDLAKTLYTRSAISKIEHSNQDLLYENAKVILEKLGVSQTEFEYIRNNYSFTPKEDIIYSFLNITYNTETATINELLKKCSYLADDPDITHIKIILTAFKNDKDQLGLTLAKKMLIPLWNDQFSKYDTWTILDLHILNMIFFIFDTETMNQISKQAITVINTKYPFLKSLKASFLLNRGILLMRSGNITQAIQALKSTCQICQKNRQYDKLLIAQTRIAICNNDKDLALHYINILHELGATDLSTSLKKEVLLFLN
ncbi:helix-turn-helix transcriptional regulator [Lactobacillus sp. ESL0680]|uniref:helix-turn-helix domain-containing protein n=1 Tax=Lactobacillus sp. ESL0680 TaxID=2983210 RepID=UPI0023F72C01|nr:helix-turn-helix transcriptional regulator [Lactobacillus sp. ESL0680]WEV39097.1 helix-turn-helix transcriptional regulator [Lactobacillus sp. ESL0680]